MGRMSLEAQEANNMETWATQRLLVAFMSLFTISQGLKQPFFSGLDLAG